MVHNMKLRNRYIIDYDNEKVNVVGTYGVLDDKGEFNNRKRYETEVSLVYFTNFCKVCIGMHCGCFGNENIKNQYGIRFYRETFDDRYFQTDELEMALGEVYIMFEVMALKLNPEKFRAFKFNQYIIFIHPKNVIVITDDTCLDVAVLATSTLFDLEFQPDGRSGNGYNKKVDLTNVAFGVLEKSAYPYVNLRYRDSGVLFTLSDFRRFRNYLRYIVEIMIEEI